MSTRPVVASWSAGLGGLLTLACSDPLTFERRGDKVLIPESYGSCQEGDACTLTGADCSGCCGVEAVRAEVEESVYPAVRRACLGYEGQHCQACMAMRREAACIGGRCTLVHTTLCSTSRAIGRLQVPGSLPPVPGVSDLPQAPGASGIKDPFSCNECTCQEDGTLSCGTTDCAMPCSAGMAKGTSCDSCGYNTNCDTLRTACLPSCESTADCAGTPGGTCTDGVCKRVCGR